MKNVFKHKKRIVNNPFDFKLAVNLFPFKTLTFHNIIYFIE